MNTIHNSQYGNYPDSTRTQLFDGISSLESLFQDILNDLGIERKTLTKGNDAVINALYICILDMLKDTLVSTDFKYPTREEFMRVYGLKFIAETDQEKTLLWQSANWMWILFKMIKPNANLGLALPVVSKLVEGLNGRIMF